MSPRTRPPRASHREAFVLADEWEEQRAELESALRRGAIIVAMTDGAAQAGGYACTVTIYTSDGHLVHFAAHAELLDGICRCSTSELR
jgi:hypothetical protein